jgi:hypothetical protein
MPVSEEARTMFIKILIFSLMVVATGTAEFRFGGVSNVIILTSGQGDQINQNGTKLDQIFLSKPTPIWSHFNNDYDLAGFVVKRSIGQQSTTPIFCCKNHRTGI